MVEYARNRKEEVERGRQSTMVITERNKLKDEEDDKIITNCKEWNSLNTN